MKAWIQSNLTIVHALLQELVHEGMGSVKAHNSACFATRISS
jgi:hypothetical protein